MARILGRIALILLLAVILLLIIGWFWLKSAEPIIRGSITLPNLQTEVHITRDSNGVPHIEAETREDAFYAIGFAHAQDRLWQMEMHRRIASGRLAEVAGEAALSSDIFLRTLSLYDRARKAWPHQTPDARAGLIAYANGVNAYLETRRGALPPEFLLTGIRPEPWTPIDTLGWLKIMAMDLGGNYWMELARFDLSRTLDPQQLADFYPPYPGDAPHPLPDLDQLYDGLDLSTIRTAATDIGKPRGLGSNNWVVSGAHTKSGLPLLANDPHLGLTTPSLWYLAHMKVGDEDIIGASMPGSPYIVLGRNSSIAWGFTNVNPDVQDLYLEKLTDDGTAYLTPDGPEPFITREEIIHVKDAPPVTITVRETRHGPVISDGRADIRSNIPENAVIALRWTALDDDDTTASMGPEIFGAKSFEDFVEAMQHYIAPEQNMVVADTRGNIGYYAPGRVPVRSPLNDTYGLVPAPGWKAGYDWTGTIPYSELPRIYNPDNGVIATANEKIIDDSYPHYLTSEWALPYRGDRIRQLIAERAPHDTASMTAIQMDVHSGVAADLLPLMLMHSKGTDDTRLKAVLDAMSDWDLEMVGDKPQPLIFTAWHRALGKHIYADELADKFFRYQGSKVEFLRGVLSDENGKARWCNDVTTPVTETCSEMVQRALKDALDDVAGRLGTTTWEKWRWDSLHQAVQEHRPFSQVPALASFFESRNGAPGGTYTVNVAGPNFGAVDPYSFTHGPSYRVVYDLADLDASRYIIPTGQSGIMFSRHYRDMLPLWLEGRSIAIKSTIPDERSGNRLTLVPKRGE